MALYGIIGDVHGNREALSSVLAFLEGRGVKEFLSVGDIVGFNADPEDCIALMRKRGVRSIAGNHDLISIHRLDFDRCCDKAAYALKRTRSVLTEDGMEYLASLPRMMVMEQRFAFVHGSLRDVQEYVRTCDQVREAGILLQTGYSGVRVCFFGHTHEQRVFELDGETVRELPAAPVEGLVRLSGERRYFINPGSVDASRKSEGKLAECAILDSTETTVEFCRIPYDHAAAEERAKTLGYRMSRTDAFLYSLRRRVRNRVRRWSGIDGDRR